MITCACIRILWQIYLCWLSHDHNHLTSSLVWFPLLQDGGYIGDHIIAMNSSQKLDFNDRFIPTGMNINSVYIADDKYYAPPLPTDWGHIVLDLSIEGTMFLTDRRILGSSAQMASTLCLWPVSCRITAPEKCSFANTFLFYYSKGAFIMLPFSFLFDSVKIHCYMVMKTKKS